MDAFTHTAYWAYTRYMDAFQALAKAEGRTDITKDLLTQLESRLHRQDADSLSEAVTSMNKRTGWINAIIDRTRQWHDAHPLAVSEFYKTVKVEGEKVSRYDEDKHRKFLAQCNNFSLAEGVHVLPDIDKRKGAEEKFRSPEYRAWKSQSRWLSLSRYEDEIRSTDIIPTPERMTTHPKTWRGWKEAVRAHQEDSPPWQRNR